MTKKEKLLTENKQLKKKIIQLKNELDQYQKLEVELSTTIDLLREGIIH